MIYKIKGGIIIKRLFLAFIILAFSIGFVACSNQNSSYKKTNTQIDSGKIGKAAPEVDTKVTLFNNQDFHYVNKYIGTGYFENRIYGYTYKNGKFVVLFSIKNVGSKSKAISTNMDISFPEIVNDDGTPYPIQASGYETKETSADGTVLNMLYSNVNLIPTALLPGATTYYKWETQSNQLKGNLHKLKIKFRKAGSLNDEILEFGLDEDKSKEIKSVVVPKEVLLNVSIKEAFINAKPIFEAFDKAEIKKITYQNGGMKLHVSIITNKDLKKAELDGIAKNGMTRYGLINNNNEEIGLLSDCTIQNKGEFIAGKETEIVFHMEQVKIMTDFTEARFVILTQEGYISSDYKDYKSDSFKIR